MAILKKISHFSLTFFKHFPSGKIVNFSKFKALKPGSTELTTKIPISYLANAHCKSDRSPCTAIWWQMVIAGPGKSPGHVHDGSCLANSCDIMTFCTRANLSTSTELSSSDVPRSSRVDSHSLQRIRPCTVLRWLRASSLNQPSSPVDGMSCITQIILIQATHIIYENSLHTAMGTFTQPKKSSCDPCLADWQTCLKKRPNPRTPRTSFSLETASNTQLSSSWSQISKWNMSVLMSSMSLYPDRRESVYN